MKNPARARAGSKGMIAIRADQGIRLRPGPLDEVVVVLVWLGVTLLFFRAPFGPVVVVVVVVVVVPWLDVLAFGFAGFPLLPWVLAVVVFVSVPKPFRASAGDMNAATEMVIAAAAASVVFVV